MTSMLVSIFKVQTKHPSPCSPATIFHCILINHRAFQLDANLGFVEQKVNADVQLCRCAYCKARVKAGHFH